MKKFTKLFLSCAAVAAVTAAVATSAMAADPVTLKGDLAGSTYADGKLTIVAPADMDTTKTATLLVVEGDGTTVEAAKVEGIDQSASGVAFDKTGLKSAPDEGKYKVMLGYYTKGENSTFKVAKSNLFGSAVIVGDVNMDGEFGTDDASAVLTHIVEENLTGDALIAAQQSNALGDTEVGTDDASEILAYIVNGESDSVGHEAQ